MQIFADVNLLCSEVPLLFENQKNKKEGKAADVGARKIVWYIPPFRDIIKLEVWKKELRMSEVQKTLRHGKCPLAASAYLKNFVQKRVNWGENRIN